MPRNQKLNRQQLYALAEEAANNSTSKLDKVGAVLYHPASGRHAVGWNHVHGYVNAPCEDENGETRIDVVHAERDSLFQAESKMPDCYFNSSIKIVTRRPCKACAMELCFRNVKAVFYRDARPEMESVEYLKKRGVLVGQWGKDDALLDELLKTEGEKPCQYN